METSRVRWERAINMLESLYKDVERRSLTLPAFSLIPLAIAMWNVLKWEVCLILDIFLILPMNLVILIRNILPGRWRFRTFSGKYWLYTISWLWRGEAPVIPIGVIRPLVKFFITKHVHNRFRSINRHIYLDDSLSEEDGTYLTRRASSVLNHWKRPTSVQVLFTYILPAGGPSIGILKFFFPGDIPQWVAYAGLILISYAITFVVSAFMCKRSLMLGASGREIFFPGAIPGDKLYERERDALTLVGISVRERPLDIWLFSVSTAIAYASIKVQIGFLESTGVPFTPDQFTNQMIVQGVLFLILISLALFRRWKTDRC